MPIFLNVICAVLFSIQLCWVYAEEMSYYWAYMRFSGNYSDSILINIIVYTIIVAVMLPTKLDTRGFILTLLNYLFFIPSIVYISFNNTNNEYILLFAINVLILIFGSKINVPAFRAIATKPESVMVFVVCMVAVALILQAAFGGLTTFDLNLDDVYLYRQEAADKMPEIFAYVYSNVSTTMIPIGLTLAFSYRRWKIVILCIIASTILFGMSHHKAVFFTSFLVITLCIIFSVSKKTAFVAMLPMVLLFYAAFDVFLHIYIRQYRELSEFASYFVRRTLLVPPMLDSAHVEFFSVFEKFYWSTSRFGLGLVKPPYDVPAPFVIGREFFNDPTMAANTGIIGSGYANGGAIGVLLYSIVTAAIIGFLNSLGRRLGHPFVAAASFPTILIIVTTADLTTVILTHGLLLLLVFLSLLPAKKVELGLEAPWRRAATPHSASLKPAPRRGQWL